MKGRHIVAEGENGKSRGAGAAFGAFVAQLVLAAVAAVCGWIARDMAPAGNADGAAEAAKAAAAAAAAARTVAVVAAEDREYNLPERYVAHAEAVQEVELLPQVDGYVKEIAFKEGDVVKAGQLLYVLDDERYRAVVNQRKADLEAANAEARRAERYYDRMQKADERGITQLERDNAEAAAETAKAAVLQAKANLVVAEYDCKKAKVFAPISGQIGKSSAHVGDYVAPSKGALAKIVQIDPVRVSFPLTDRAYIAWRQSGKKGDDGAVRLRLLLADGSEYGQEGKWDFDDNQMSLETASIMMRLSFPNSERLLVPNSYVTLLADFKNPPRFPSVPQQSVVDLQGGNRGVWVLKDDMTVECRAVEVRESFAGWTPVTSGLAAGEKVVVSGVTKLVPGAKVSLAEATPNDDLAPGTAPKVRD